MPSFDGLLDGVIANVLTGAHADGFDGNRYNATDDDNRFIIDAHANAGDQAGGRNETILNGKNNGTNVLVFGDIHNHIVAYLYHIAMSLWYYHSNK